MLRPTLLPLAACALAGIGSAQCVGGPPAQRLRTLDPFQVSFFVGPLGPTPAAFRGTNLLVDLTAACDISVTSMETLLYDEGLGSPPNPNQVGNTADITVYACANSHVGQSGVPPGPGSPWRVAGTGSMVVQPFTQRSVVVLDAPIFLAAGSHGLAALVAPTRGGQPNEGPLHPVVGDGLPCPVMDDGFVQLTNCESQPDAFSSVFIGTPGPNLQIDYLPAVTAGYSEGFGDACGLLPLGFFEEFDPVGNPFDLAGASIRMTPGPAEYVVRAGAAGFVPPSSPALTLSAPAVSTSAGWDDALSTPISLPFSFPYSGRSTNQITVSSNGAVFLDAVSQREAAVGYYGRFSEFRDLPARLAPFFGDLDPSAAGGIHVDFYGGGEARITFAGVPEFGVPGSSYTFQVVIDQNGAVEFVYQSMATPTLPAITGYTVGNGAERLLGQDLTAAVPFSCGNVYAIPTLTTAGRPVMGGGFDVLVEGVTPGTAIVFLVTGVSLEPTPVSLVPLGMPGCVQYVSPQDTWLMSVDPAAESATLPLQVPNQSALLGLRLFAQAAPFTAGINPAGTLTTPGLCIRVGDQ